MHDPLALVLPGGLLRRLGVGGEQVAERGVAVFADLLVEADERGALVAHLLDLLDRQAGLRGELLERGLAAEAHRQLALDAADLARALGDVDGQADRASGVLQAALDRLADPQRGVGREAKALAPVELLAGADQAEHALLDEVAERQALVLVAPRVGGDEAQVGVDEQFLGVQVAALDPLGEVDLLGRGEQGVAARVREKLVDGLRDERVGGADVDALDRAVEPLGRSDRSASSTTAPSASRLERLGVVGFVCGLSDMGVLLIRCLESELYATIVALSTILLGAFREARSTLGTASPACADHDKLPAPYSSRNPPSAPKRSDRCAWHRVSAGMRPRGELRRAKLGA